MERITRGKGFYMVLSVLIALGIWVYVRQVVNPDASGVVRGVPITFVGTDALESRRLMIVSDPMLTVNVNVTGKLNAVSAVTPEMVAATVDVSAVTEPGQYTSAYHVSFNLPSYISGTLATSDRNSQRISYTVVREATRTIPVSGSVAGDVAEGYQSGEFLFSPQSIQVKGEESLVNKIDYALVTLDNTDLTETYSGELPYTLVGRDNEIISADELETDVALIHTTLPILRLKEVPLTLDIVPGGGANKDNVSIKVTPKTILVSGEPADVEPLKGVSLGQIDLAKVLHNGILTFPIDLATELTNVSGITEAVVEIGNIERFTTATFEVDNIELIHVPDGYQARTMTQTKQITVRGSASAVASVSASQLRIVADLDNAVAETGTQTIPVKVYLDNRNDVGVVSDYNIAVSITRQ